MLEGKASLIFAVILRDDDEELSAGTTSVFFVGSRMLIGF
jgi:hypothetical protein